MSTFAFIITVLTVAALAGSKRSGDALVILGVLGVLGIGVSFMCLMLYLLGIIQMMTDLRWI